MNTKKKAPLLSRLGGAEGTQGGFIRAKVGIIYLLLVLGVLVFREVHYRALLSSAGVDENGLRKGSSQQAATDAPKPTWVYDESWRDVGSALEDNPAFNLSDPMTHQFASHIEEALFPWSTIPGIRNGMGSRGLVSYDALHLMAGLPSFMSCAGHVRIVKGKVYFRYGGFISIWYRLRRFNQSIKMLQDAIDQYKLHHIRVEFFLNTCDLPISFDSAQSSGRSGFPIFSTQWSPGTTDIVVPDPLDLSEDYMPDAASQIPWEQKVAKAVFRGASTNYELRDYNWRVSPRFRVHRLTELFRELLDARVMRWSHANAETVIKIESDGLRIGQRINQKTKNMFKYEIVVDGGVGTCRTCGVLASNQVMIRQESPFQEFFEPFMKPGVHFLPTRHHFNDLPKVVDWAVKNDDKAREVVRNANKLANYICTWEGRTLYWAIILAKYHHKVMEDPTQVEIPSSLCGGKPPKAVLEVVPLNSKEATYQYPTCGTVEAETTWQAECTFFCIAGKLREEKWYWLTSDQLASIERLGPHMM